jgi:hypothetical protein
MQSLKQALTIERNRLFVGRESELGFMQNWLVEHDAPSEVLFISGMGGIGKSALMLQFLNMAQEENILCIWLDGRVCTATPAGFLESLHSFLIQNSRCESDSKTSMSDIATAMSKQRTLLCIDNYEHLHPIEGWLREVFLPHLSATGLLVVFAARQDLAIDWQNDLAWRKRVRQMRLAPISRLESLDFYTIRGLDNNAEIEQLISDTKGLPLAMALSADRVQLTRLESGISTWSISTRVSAELLREVATPDLKELLDLLCILPQAVPGLLGRLLGNPLSTMNLHQLSQISFVRPTVDGFSLHDVARAYLIEDFLHREPARYQMLRLQIVEEMVKELKQADIEGKTRIAANVLSICRDAFRVGSNSIFAANPFSFAMDSFRNGDLPHLHRLLTEQGQAAISLASDSKIHELLDSLAEQFPECIRVFRSADGIPLAYIAGLLLYRETMLLLDPFIPSVLDSCFPLEATSMRQLRLEEADTYYQLLAAASISDPSHSFYELNGILVTESFSRNSAAGMRSLLVTKMEETNELLLKLGFRVRPLPGLPKEHPSHGAYIHELDLRSSNFGEYVLAFLKESTDDYGQGSMGSVFTEGDVQKALSIAGNALALERSELARKLNYSGPALQQVLQRILFHDHPLYPLNSRKQALLQLYYEMPSLTVELAAEQLHISRATYYRSRNEALGDLKELLTRYVP